MSERYYWASGSQRRAWDGLDVEQRRVAQVLIGRSVAGADVAGEARTVSRLDADVVLASDVLAELVKTESTLRGVRLVCSLEEIVETKTDWDKRGFYRRLVAARGSLDDEIVGHAWRRWTRRE